MKQNKQIKPIGHAIAYRPVVLPKATVDRILALKKKPGIALALYTFYYYTGVWQETNQPKCTVSYAIRGLQIGREAIQMAKKQLMELGLIEEIRGRARKNGREFIKDHFIRVRYYEGPSDVPTGFSTGTETLPVRKPAVNAYSTDKRNAYSTGIVDGTKRPMRRNAKPDLLGRKDKETPSHRLSIQLFKIVRPLEEGRPNKLPKKDQDTGKRDFRAWDSAFRELLDHGKYSEQEVSAVLVWYAIHHSDEFTPRARSARTFCQRYGDILAAMERQQKDQDRQRKKEGLSPKYTTVEEGEKRRDPKTGNLLSSHLIYYHEDQEPDATEEGD